MVTQTMNKGSSTRGMTKTRAYGKMLILAFGLAVIAVMVVHKLRERRILNLIVEDRDEQLISLHLLLQREMDLSKEMSRKIEDLRPRLHMLRSQKMELNGRVIELQSTVASLKDDIKAVESNLHIRNEENKMLRDKITEILKEKDAEIEHLKRINTEQQQGVKGQSMEDQLLNSSGTMNKVVEVDANRVEESKGGEISTNVTRNVEDQDGQGRVGDVTKGGMNLEVPHASKYGGGFRGDGKRGDVSRTKGRKWRRNAKNGRLGNHAMVLRSREVPEVQSKGELDPETHDDDVRGTLDASTKDTEKPIDTEAFRTNETKVITNDGRLGTSVNQVVDDSTMEKGDDTNSRVNVDSIATLESRITDDHHELKGNEESSDDVSQKVEFKDTPNEWISNLENMTNRWVDSKTDDDAKGDLILPKAVTEHALQHSEAEETSNGSSDSVFGQDQHDPNSHSQNDDDPQESEVEEVHINAGKEDAYSKGSAIEGKKEEYNA